MRILLPLSSALLLGCAPNVLAQAQEPFLLGTIVVEAQDPNAVGVSPEDLERNDPGDLQDVFKNEPTISVSSSIPLSQKVFVNGVEEVNLATSIDGARQNNKTFHHNATTYIDPTILKQVRIDPGVAPADAGPGALAGAIGYETKDVADFLADGETMGGILSSEYQTNGEIFASDLTLFGRTETVEGLLYFKYADGGIRTDGDGDDIIGSGTGILSGLGKVALTFGNNRVEVAYQNVTDDEARPYRADIGQLIGGRPVPDTRVYDLNRQNLVVTYSALEATEWFDPKVSLSYSGTSVYLPEDDQTYDAETDSISGTVQNTFDLGTGTITAGIDFFVDRAVSDYRFLADSAFDEYAKEESRNVGIFAQGRFDVGARGRLSAGLRADLNELTGTDGSTFTEAGVSGNIVGEVDVTDVLTLGAGASHVFGGIPLAENAIMNPNWVYPDEMDAVTANNYFFSADADFGAVNLKAKVFRTEISNARAASYGDGPGITADLESEGFELGANYDWGPGFVSIGYASISTDVNGFAADSFTGRYLTAPLGDMITIAIAHEFEQWGVTVGADAQFALEDQGSYLGVDTNIIPGYEVANAFVEYTPPSYANLTLRAEVNNIFDARYAERGTYGQDFLDDGVTPLYEPGRSFALRGTIRF